MNRRSDIGWFELIVGIILIIFGVVIMRQPVGVLTWIVILCGVLAILSGIGDIVLVNIDGGAGNMLLDDNHAIVDLVICGIVDNYTVYGETTVI